MGTPITAIESIAKDRAFCLCRCSLISRIKQESSSVDALQQLGTAPTHLYYRWGLAKSDRVAASLFQLNAGRDVEHNCTRLLAQLNMWRLPDGWKRHGRLLDHPQRWSLRRGHKKNSHPLRMAVLTKRCDPSEKVKIGSKLLRPMRAPCL